MIERLQDLEQLAPPLVWLLVFDVAGEPRPEWAGENEVGFAISRLSAIAARRSLVDWREMKPGRTGQSFGRLSIEEFDELRHFREAADDELVDEINLAITRLGGNERTATDGD